MATQNDIQGYILALVNTARGVIGSSGSTVAASASYTIESIDDTIAASAVFADFNPKFESFDIVINDATVLNSIWTIFNTAPGERVMSPGWGTNMRYMLFENITMDLVEQATIDISKALRTTDPRIQLNDVSIMQNGNDGNLIDIFIDVTIKMLSSRVKISITQPV